MKIWEYCKLYESGNEFYAVQLTNKGYTLLFSSVDLDIAIALLGIDGWELVTIDKFGSYLFKREK